MATRKTFNPHADDSIANDLPKAPARLKCFAYGCKMAGAINTGGTDWSCAFHYRVPAPDLPRVTSILVEHSTVVHELLELQALLLEHPTDGRAHQATMGLARHHIELAGHTDIVESLPRGIWPTGPDDFVRALHAYLGGKVIGVRRVRREQDNIPTGYRMQRATAQPVSDYVPATRGQA